MTRAFEDQHIRQYLLGDLPEAQESELETAYFGDPALLERVELARSDLADDYAAARLSAAERQKFEQRILATHDGREQLAIAQALQSAGAAGSSGQASHREAARATADAAVPRGSQVLDRRWLGLAAAVMLAIGAALVWRLVSTPEPAVERADARPETSRAAPPTPVPAPGTPADQPRAEAQGRSGTVPVTPAMTIAVLILTPDLERSGGLPPTLLTSSGATHVDLVAPPNGPTTGPTRARVASVEGKAVWSGAMTIPGVASSDARPRARVPVSALPPGDYLLSIEADQNDPSGGSKFYFRVRAK